MTTAAGFAPAPEDLEAYRLLEHDVEHDDRVTVLRIEDRPGVDLADATPDLLKGIAVLKAGVFNTVVEVDIDDLHAYVARFDELRGVMRPPLRIDHGWSILEVIGRFVDLRVENRPDDTLGGTIVPMLVGDVQLVGTPEENAQIKAWIKSGKLDERSSELRWYRTNTGVEYPVVFGGCAFVDIPAVEGLGTITLRRDGAPTDREVDTMPDTDTDLEQQVDEQVDEQTDAESTADATDEEPSDELGDADADEEPSDETDDPTGEDEDEDEQVDPHVDVAASADLELVANLQASGATPAEILAALTAAVDARVEVKLQAERRIDAQTARGVIPLTARPQVERLLRHTEQGVRDDVAALLEALPQPVKLDAAEGHLSGASRSPSAAGTTVDELRELSRAEFGKAWADLTPDQRASDNFRDAYRSVMGAYPAR